MDRRGLEDAVFSVLETNNIPLKCLQGSFSTGDFHFDANNYCSYSDVDLVIPNCGDRAPLKEKVSNEIYRLTGITLDVSIHSSSVLQQLNSEQSEDLAVLECIYQCSSVKYRCADYRNYIKCKISRVLLEECELVDQSFAEENEQTVQYFNAVKLGASDSVEKSRAHNKWPTPKRHPRFWIGFFENDLTSESTPKHYHTLLGSTTLPKELLERIREKLTNTGFETL